MFARTGLARPKLTLGVWLAVVGALALLGLGVEHRLETAAIYINGTPSNLAKELEKHGFGDDDFLVVMLRGPAASIERQGSALARTLQVNSRVTVISPWTGTGTIRGLRPSPDVAALVVNVLRRPGDGFLAVLPPVTNAVARVVRAPVRADVSSAATVTQGMTRQAEDVAASSQKIVIPVLAIVLLIVFGSPVSALIPGLMGGATVAASRGILALLMGTVPLDSLAPDLVGMMGLALGVDYSLLIISRFREEVRAGRSYPEAAEVTVLTTGRAVVFAGCALLLAMLVAAQVLPGAIVVSAAIAIAITSVFSVFSALLVVPAMLVLAGPYLERWAIIRRDPDKLGFAARMSQRFTKRSALVVALVLLPLLVACAAAFGVKTGPPSVGLLPPSEPDRQQYEAVSRTLGPGWGGSLNIIVNGGSSPITEPSTLRALARFEQRVEHDPGVETVAGIETIYRGLRPLGSFASGLHRASTGASTLRSGSGQARDGAGLLQQGLQAADSGARTLQEGTATAYEGGRRLANGSLSADAGAHQVAAGAGAVESGVQRLHSGAQKLANGLQVGASQLDAQQAAVRSMERNIAKALAALGAMTAGKQDPHYRETLEAVQQADAALTGQDPATGKPDPTFAGVSTGLALGRHELTEAVAAATKGAHSSDELLAGVRRLRSGSERLAGGIASLSAGGSSLAGGLGQLTSGTNRLSSGIATLDGRSGQLVSGLTRLETGAASLAQGLGAGGGSQSAPAHVAVSDPSGGLSSRTGGSPSTAGGLSSRTGGSSFTAGESSSRAGESSSTASGSSSTAHASSQGQGRPTDPPSSESGLGALQRTSPGFFRSGYIYLAAIDGAPAKSRRQAQLLVDLAAGGHMARIEVIPTTGPLSPATGRTRSRLEGYARELAASTHTQVVVGGPAATLEEYNTVMRSRVPFAIVALALMTLLVLVPVLRSLIVPLAAIVLNIITVGATFGLMALLFNNQTLGGPGYIDAISVGSIVTVAFGLSIDYEVFVLARIREEYLRLGDSEQAILGGLAHTARVVTGAAAIMITVFLTFALSQFVSIRDFGVALAIAVAIDAFLIRMLVLPAIMRMLGDRCWWLPAWLDRILPRLDIEGSYLPRPVARPKLGTGPARIGRAEV